MIKFPGDIPKNWSLTTLGIVRFNQSISIDLNKFSNEYFELYSVPSFNDGRPEIKLGKDIGSSKKTVMNNTVLLCKINPRINRVWIVGNYSSKKKIASTEWIPFFNIIGLDPKYLKYYLENNHFRNYLASNVSGVGGSLMRVKPSTVDVYPFPMAPLPEQYRIVAKIEELFTRLDAGVEALKQGQAQLTRYRQSLLKTAVEGRLTAEWREQHLEELEPADKLLERIFKERREKWEAEQLSRYEAQGKTPPENWQDKYKEPIFSNASYHPELPKSWKWASIDQISYEVRYGSSSKTNTDPNGIPILRMGNIVEGNLVFDKLKYLPENHDEFPDILLASGDLLFNRTNSVELVGKTAVYKGYPSPCSYASYLIRVRFCREVEPNFISFFINSVYGRAWIRTVVSQQVGQANVNGTKLKYLAVPLPPFDEQKKIVSELERLFSIIYESESLIHREINRAQSLKQSILKQAFEGKLVPQNPKDDPASVLLERIKTEKAKPKKSKQMEMF